MKLLGNIITALICLTSFGFFFISLIVVASHANWKKIAIDNKRVAENLDRQRRTAEENVVRNQTQINKLRLAAAYQIALLNSTATQATSERDAERKRATNAQSDLTVTTQNLRASQESLKKKTSDNEELRKQVISTKEEVATQAAKIAKLQSELEQTVLLANRLKALNQKHRDEFHELNQVAMSKNFDRHTLKTEIPPNLRGRVTSISTAQKGVFSLSFGEDDGLRNGHVVDVTRNGRHIGTARVIQADANASTAKFLPGMQNERTQLNDRVTTELSKKFSLEQSDVAAK